MMAGGIAHDFNNRLLVMLVHAELLRNDEDPADARLAGVFEIIQSIGRAQALTRQLLAFSRKQPSETKVVNPGEVVARPDIPLNFMTGYSEDPVSSVSGGTRIANHRAIMKPFRPRDLLSMVREVLDARTQAAA